jgi:transcriptional regulator with XRE-family HTH domain
VDENWTAVGQAISQRLEERGMTMTDLANQSDISLTTIRELVHVLSTRRRHPRTLGKVSTTLGWPEDHLLQVLRGGTSEPDSRTELGELKALRQEVRDLRDRVEALEGKWG